MQASCSTPVMRASPAPPRRRVSRDSLTDDEVSELMTERQRGASVAGVSLTVPGQPGPEQNRWEHINSPDPTQRAAGERTRRKLQFFFMNPVDKWRARKRPPYKLTIQIVKIVLVTLQLCMFASRRYSHISYIGNSQYSMDHLFLMGWDVAREVNAYPPGIGPLAVYTQEKFYEALDFAVNNYYDLDSKSVSGIAYPEETGPRMELCVDEYRMAEVFPANQSYTFDARSRTRCLQVVPAQNEISNHNFSTKSYIQQHNFSLPLVGMLETRLTFILNAIKLKVVMPLDVPDCYRFNISLILDNRNQDGQILISLETEPHVQECSGDVEFVSDNTEIQILFTLVNLLVMVVCLVSFFMCVRAIYRAQLLRSETEQVLRQFFEYELSSEERGRFLNLWYILIIANDSFIIVASLLKIQLENRVVSAEIGADAWNICSVLLGVGNLLVWIGVLRYLGFFRSYNVLILTVRKSMPSVLRFLVCALICYGGFVFCGWLILSPYHMKFRTVSRTSETLFSLMNGDDMFATFAQVANKSRLVYWFSKLYIYIFVFFFIYLVLSLMISIIMEAYDTIKSYYQHGFPRTPLDEFILARRLDPSTGVYREDQDELLIFRLMTAWSGCCKPDPSLTEDPPVAGATDSPEDASADETTPLMGGRSVKA